MNRITLALAGAFAIAGFTAGAQAAPQQVDEPEEAASARQDARGRSADDRVCVEQTGTRITAARHARSRSDQRDCVAGGGRVYTRKDIESTGSTDLRDALRRLDPSIY